MAQPPHTGGKRGIVPDFGQLELPAGYRYTTLCRGVCADNHDWFAELAHALHHMRRACGSPIPEREEQVAGLRHLVIAAHTGRLPEALPVGAEELMLDLMLPGPAVAELVSAFGTAGEDLRDAGALRGQRLAQELIIRKRA